MSSTAMHEEPLRKSILLVAVLALSAATLQGHDFWIEPQTFAPRAGETVPLFLLVGDHFEGEIFPRSASHIARFSAQTPLGRVDVAGLDGQSPAGYLAAAENGSYVVGYRSHRSFTTMELPAFRDYLREEGLDSVIDQVSGLGDGGSVREAFSRCAKSILRVAPGDSKGFDSRLGLRLELVARTDPSRIAPGDSIEVELLFEGRPLEGALITARPKEQPMAATTGRSDANGVTRLEITRPGMWMVKTVHMIPPEEGLEADWESLWATLTFQVGE